MPSTARSGGTVTSMTTATVPEAGISAIGVLPRSGWVAVTNASPSRRSSVSPSGAVTAIDVRVTGAANPLVTSRSYSRWSSPSLPDTRNGSFVAETTIAVVFTPAAGEATEVASWAHPFPGSVAMVPPIRHAARIGRSRGIIIVTSGRENCRLASAIAVRLVRRAKVRSGRAAGSQGVPGVRVAYALKHLLNRFDHQLRLILVDVVAALGGDGKVGIGDEGGQILLQIVHDGFHLDSRPARKRVAKRDAVHQHDQRHRVQRGLLARLAYLGAGSRVVKRG